MNRREFLSQASKATLGLAGTTVLSHWLEGCSILGKKEKPNIVFILADDLGWNQVRYHGLTDFYETPNIDSIANAGIHFIDAYAAAPVCSPTRASLMTGKHPARLHLTDYIPGSPYPYARLTTPKQVKALPLEEVTIAELLKQAGYITGHFGKWHLSPDKKYKPGRPFDPGSQGFDVVFTSVKPKPNADPNKDAHHTVEITQRSIQFIEKYKNQPFFAYVSYHAVHRPIMETEELIAKYKKKPGADLPENNPIMGAMIERMDRGIGEILATLDRLDLASKTIVVFYSDNGGFEQLQSQKPLRGGKAMLFEGGIRVPLAIRWPGVISAGMKSEALLTSHDFFPTFAEIVGVPLNIPDIDGKSLMPVLNRSGEINREALYWHYPHYHHLGFKPSGAIRMGDYKLIEWYEETLLNMDNQISLYNLKEDIGESKNLAATMPDKARELRQRLHQWRKAVKAQEMTVNPDYDPERADQRFAT